MIEVSTTLLRYGFFASDSDFYTAKVGSQAVGDCVSGVDMYHANLER